MVNVFSNPKLLTNIQEAKSTLTLHYNSDKAIVTKRGSKRIQHYLDGIGNILYLKNVQKKHKVTYESSEKTCFINQKGRQYQPCIYAL